MQASAAEYLDVFEESFDNKIAISFEKGLVCKISRTTLTEWIKHLKFGRAEKLFAPAERRRKSILNPSQREQIERWMDKIFRFIYT